MGQQDDRTTEDVTTRSQEHGLAIEAEMPAVVRAAGWTDLASMREKSCLGTPDPEAAARKTNWESRSSTSGVEREEAVQIADEVRAAAKKAGWSEEPRGNTAPNQETLFAGTKGELNLVVHYTSGTGSPELSIAMSSPCLEMPAGHTMTRSELDPMYGSSDPMYPNDDRSKFTNGKSKPLPEPSPTASDQ